MLNKRRKSVSITIQKLKLSKVLIQKRKKIKTKVK